MKNFARLAVHQRWSADDLASKYLADGLVSETNTQYRYGFVEVPDGILCNSRIGGRAGSRRNDNTRGFQSLDFFERDLIISKYAQVFAQLAKILHEVISKGIVVIDDDNHISNPRWARLIARIRSRDLFTVSVYSFSGTESATIPPPAWIYPLLPRTTSVRMAMHESRLLLKSAYITAPA